MKDAIEKKLTGKTIESCEVIRAEFGRTYDQYICLVFTDGSKVMLYGSEPWQPEPPIDEMKKAPHYFSASDIAYKVERDEIKRRDRIAEDKRQKQREYEKLKKELEA